MNNNTDLHSLTNEELEELKKSLEGTVAAQKGRQEALKVLLVWPPLLR